MNAQINLGFSRNSKLLIIHADDAGLSFSENEATLKSMKLGCVNSASVMVPCPRFLDMAKIIDKNWDLDFGIHLTLTSEWKNYKWGPVSPIDQVKSLVNDKGHFYSNVKHLVENAKPIEIELEIAAQIKKAISVGIRPTHLDSHQFVLLKHPIFIDIYKNTGRKYKLPILLNLELIKSNGIKIDKTIAESFLIDHVYINRHLTSKQDQKNYYKNVLENLSPGISILIIHPAFNNNEMKSITKEAKKFGAFWRQSDYEFFTSDCCEYLIKKNEIKLITWKKIRTELKHKFK